MYKPDITPLTEIEGRKFLQAWWICWFCNYLHVPKSQFYTVTSGEPGANCGRCNRITTMEFQGYRDF